MMKSFIPAVTALGIALSFGANIANASTLNAAGASGSEVKRASKMNPQTGEVFEKDDESGQYKLVGHLVHDPNAPGGIARNPDGTPHVVRLEKPVVQEAPAPNRSATIKNRHIGNKDGYSGHHNSRNLKFRSMNNPLGGEFIVGAGFFTPDVFKMQMHHSDNAVTASRIVGPPKGCVLNMSPENHATLQVALQAVDSRDPNAAAVAAEKLKGLDGSDRVAALLVAHQSKVAEQRGAEQRASLVRAILGTFLVCGDAAVAKMSHGITGGASPVTGGGTVGQGSTLVPEEDLVDFPPSQTGGIAVQ